MKLCSFIANGQPRFGAVVGAAGIVDLSGRLAGCTDLLAVVRHDAFGAIRDILTTSPAADFREDDVEFLPVLSGDHTIHCIGLNYAAHAAEGGRKAPDFPRTFFKIPAALVGHRQALTMPTLSPQFDYEGELAVVIGKTAHQVAEEDAYRHVAGYTCFMDGSVRDWQLNRTLDQGKNFYRSSAMGPYLVTADEVGALESLTLTTRLNGEQVQHSGLDQMIHSVPALIAYISSFTELRVGDVIATGTPEGVGHRRNPPRFLRPGDRLEVSVDRVGTLVNDVV